MKLRVFGPTGFIGEQIAREALAAGHEVTAVARRVLGLVLGYLLKRLESMRACVAYHARSDLGASF